MTYTHLTTNELVMIKAYYWINIIVFRYCDFTWKIKTENLQCHQLSERGASPLITMDGIKSIRKDVIGIKQGLHKKIYPNSFGAKLEPLYHKRTYPDKISCFMRTLNRLPDIVVFDKISLPWSETRKKIGLKEALEKQTFWRDL